jgi:Uma2 family endonuclease
MATTTETRAAQDLGDQCVEFRAVGWKGYSKLLKIRGDRGTPRMVYLDGDLFLMSPSYPHERLKHLLGLFVMVVAEELDISCHAAASTTFRRRKKDVGVEGDQTFYIANAGRVRGKVDLDLRQDPPPDLAIEAVQTHPVGSSIEVYRRLGVPEVWICDGSELQILVLRENGRYRESAKSVSFPFLSGDEILVKLNDAKVYLDTEWTKSLRRWVRETVLPRSMGERRGSETDPV